MDKIRNVHIRGTTRVAHSSNKITDRKTTEVGQPCEENERGAHSEKMWTHRGKEEEDGQTYEGKTHARET